MIKLDTQLTPADLLPQLERFWARSAQCIDAVDASCPLGTASPVFTVNGRYTSKGWTEWTQGFQFGSALLQFDATGDKRILELGRERTIAVMAPHLTHVGVHDHGFNNVSTYGNLWRLMNERRLPEDLWQRRFYELALKASGAVQAARWAKTADGTGYIYSFNGPQSLFVDTIRSLRSLALAHQLGHVLVGERDERIDLLHRLVEHATNTARYNVWYGEARDAYDVAGRTVHESIFNTNNGQYRCPNYTARLLALHHVDPRPRVGNARLCRAARMARNAEQRRLQRDRRPRCHRKRVHESCPSDVRFLHPRNTDLRRALLGHRCAWPVKTWQLPRTSRRSVQRLRTGRQLGRRNCGSRAVTIWPLSRP